MKLWVTHTYENSFEIEIDDNATDEEIIKTVIDEDEYLGGDWNVDWEVVEK